MTFICQRSKQHQGGLNRAPQADYGDFRIHKHEKMFAGGKGKKKYPARWCKVCVAQKNQSETRYICKFCVPHHKGSCFEKYHSVINY
jgi:hypothetical protein